VTNIILDTLGRFFSIAWTVWADRFAFERTVPTFQLTVSVGMKKFMAHEFKTVKLSEGYHLRHDHRSFSSASKPRQIGVAERYERGSVMLTSNLPFSKWEQIFKDAMTTAAAIDRLVHHSVIVELNVSSYRLENAKREDSEKKGE
jgi:hypothetical protein